MAGLSRIALARGALPDAVAHAEEMYRHLHGRLKILEPLRMYLTCWQIFHATSDPRAEAVLRHASTLLAEQAARIDDPQLRRSFLEHVATHRQITTAAARNLYAPIELLVL